MATKRTVRQTKPVAAPQKKAAAAPPAEAALGFPVEEKAFSIADQPVFKIAGQNAFQLSDAILLKDNTPFTDRFLPPVPPKIVFSKTVVIAQDPPAGNVVPAGTAVTLTLAQKRIIPITSFNVNPKIREAYAGKSVGDLLSDVASDNTAKLILDQNKPYDALNANEIAPIHALIQKRFGLSPTDPNFGTQAKSIYGDLQFLNNA